MTYTGPDEETICTDANSLHTVQSISDCTFSIYTMKVRYENDEAYCMRSENAGPTRKHVRVVSPYTVHPQCVYIELLEVRSSMTAR